MNILTDAQIKIELRGDIEKPTLKKTILGTQHNICAAFVLFMQNTPGMYQIMKAAVTAYENKNSDSQ